MDQPVYGAVGHPWISQVFAEARLRLGSLSDFGLRLGQRASGFVTEFRNRNLDDFSDPIADFERNHPHRLGR